MLYKHSLYKRSKSKCQFLHFAQIQAQKNAKFYAKLGLVKRKSICYNKYNEIRKGLYSMARKPTMKKVLMTLNNPTEHGIDWKEFKFRLNLLPTFDYLVICEERGVQELTPHFHAYIHFHTGVSFDRLKQLFPSCHIDFPQGTDLENKMYLTKSGKWADTEKGSSEYHLKDEEYGTIKENYTSEERYKFKPDTAEVFANIYTMAMSGMSPLQIVEEMPCAIKYLYQVEKLCKMFQKQEQEKKAEALRKALKEKEENSNFDNDTLSKAFEDYLQ